MKYVSFSISSLGSSVKKPVEGVSLSSSRHPLALRDGSIYLDFLLCGMADQGMVPDLDQATIDQMSLASRRSDLDVRQPDNRIGLKGWHLPERRLGYPPKTFLSRPAATHKCD